MIGQQTKFDSITITSTCDCGSYNPSKNKCRKVLKAGVRDLKCGHLKFSAAALPVLISSSVTQPPNFIINMFKMLNCDYSTEGF